jgi:long-chain fatty acid transport protein
MRKGFILFCTAALVTVTAQPLLAGGIDNKHNWSAEYIRTLNRNAATDYADIVAYNPAGIMFMDNGSYVNLSAHYLGKTYTNTINGTDLESDKASVVPGTFAIYKTDKWSAFAGFTIPDGGGKVEYDNGNVTTRSAGLGIMAGANAALDAAQAGGLLPPGVTASMLYYSGINSEKLHAESYYFGYTIGGAYKINDNVSVSAGVRFVDAHQESQASLTVSAANTIAGVNDDVNATIDYEEDADGWGAVLGINVTPMEGVNLALRYETKTELEFKYKVAEDNVGVLASLGITNGVTHDRDLPGILGLGASYQVNPKLKVDVNLTYYFNEDADWEGDEEKVDNGYDIGAALEYAINDKTKASFGFMHTDVGIDAQDMLAEAPQLDANTIGTGIAYKYNDNVDLNFSLGKVFYDDASYTDTTTGLNITYEKDILFLGFGAQYKF